MVDRGRGRRATADEQDDGSAVDLDERKERVLHTRVPESLDRHVKRRARNLGLSVSTVVRNVLLNTFGLVEDIVTDSANIARSITGEEALPPAGRMQPGTERVPNAVLGWQEAVLNLNAVCDQCNGLLPKGTAAAIGVPQGPGPRTIICTTCLGKLRAGTRARGTRPARRH